MRRHQPAEPHPPDSSQPYPHPHLICVRCRKIMDPQVSLVDDLTQEVAALTGSEVISHRLHFYGVCPDWRSANDSKPVKQLTRRKE